MTITWRTYESGRGVDDGKLDTYLFIFFSNQSRLIDIHDYDFLGGKQPNFEGNLMSL